MIIRYTVPEIWYMTNVIVIFILGYTFRFYHSPSTSLKNKNFKTMKKGLEISFYTSVLKNYDHMLYCSWDMVCDGCNCYFSFWAIFCTFTPLRARKIKLKKNAWRYHHFTLVYQNSWLYAILFLRYDVVCNSS